MLILTALTSIQQWLFPPDYRQAWETFLNLPWTCLNLHSSDLTTVEMAKMKTMIFQNGRRLLRSLSLAPGPQIWWWWWCWCRWWWWWWSDALHQVHNSGPCQHRQFIFPSIWWTGNILILISVFDQNQNLKALVNFIFWFSSEQWNIF